MTVEFCREKSERKEMEPAPPLAVRIDSDVYA
jgi:hypothetical protein